MKRKVIIIGIIVVVIAAGLLLRQRSLVKADSATAIATAPVIKKDFVKRVESSGKTKAGKSVDLKFQTSGRLAWVGVKEGDNVSAYQAIAGMDVREVQKTLEKSLRDYSSQRNTFDQTWKVTYNNVQDPTTAPNDTVRRILEKNQWDLEKSVLDVELKHLSLEYATLVTPIAGLVTHIDTPVAGINITPATSVFEIIDPDSIVFEAKIDEVDVGLLSVGQEAIVSLDAYPDREFKATITRIAYAAETSTGGATVFPVELTLSDSQSLRVGFNGDVRIDASKMSDALVIPVSALREESKSKYVFKKVGDSYKKIPVTVSTTSDNEAVITEGLAQGDQIVTKGFTQIPATKP